MTKTSPFGSEFAWSLMTAMEQALYGTMLALHADELDGGLAVADAAIAKLRTIAGVRSRLPEPEYEAARSGLNMEYEEFTIWYPIQYRIRHGFDRDYQHPTLERIQEAYKRFGLSRCDFY